MNENESFELEDFGWNDFFATQFRLCATDGSAPARVSFEGREAYRVLCAQGELIAELAGKLRYDAATRAGLPAVGDWVAARIAPRGRALILGVLPRRSKISRHAAGRATDEQILAANVDTILIVTSLNEEFNLRRIERYLALAWESGVQPTLLLTKADLCEDARPYLAGLNSVARGVPVLVVSAQTGFGMEQFRAILVRGKTYALLGSSGVGKSTLINRLTGRWAGQGALRTREILADRARGRHATTARQLVVLPSGGVLLDTPGLRELQLWSGAEGFGRAFEDIESLAARCRFRDCRHQTEPGCAVQAALLAGSLDAGRYENYRKLERELAFQERKRDAALQSAYEKHWRQIHKELKRMKKW